MRPEVLTQLIAWRHELHQAPELSGYEVQTAARICAWLATCAPDRILTGLGGTGIAAVFDGAEDGPTLGIRCELDALPIHEETDLSYASQTSGHGHLCGHDGHMVMVLGVAQALAAKRPERGRVVLIFQPAEETGEGAIAYRAAADFAAISPDIVLSLHNLPGLKLGEVLLPKAAANCASRGARIRLMGKTSHAAAPQDGLSPAPALAALMTELAALGTGGALDESFTLTTVTHAELGAKTFGVAPGAAELWVTLRAATNAAMAGLVHAVEARVAVLTAECGLRQEITYHDVFEACRNASEAVDLLAKSCEREQVSLQMTDRPQAFSEDFGQFGKSAQAAMFWLGAGEAHPQLHNPDYDFPDALIPIGTGIFTRAIRELLG